MSNQWFSLEETPLILLYEHMTVHGCEVVTTLSNAGR